MELEDQQQICDWRIKYNTYSRQGFINDKQQWLDKQYEWYHSYDRDRNHFFAIAQNTDEKNNNLLGITGLKDIDYVDYKAEIHHFIGENYIDENISKASIDLICDYAFKDLSLNCVYVETFEHDHKKFNFFKNYGFKHLCLWPQKTATKQKDNNEVNFINVNIQILLKNGESTDD